MADRHPDRVKPGEREGEEARGIGDVVASHYNNLDEKGVDQRKQSRIFFMRNLNNWIKSQLIQEYMEKIRRSPDKAFYVNVLDIGCGKGGDLMKWAKAGDVDHIVCCDIAKTSVEQCRARFRDLRSRPNMGHLYSAEFHAADCTRTNLSSLYSDPQIEFSIVSCQFAFHYCFESVEQADCMLHNVSQRLRVGGYFIGTIPDAYDIVQRVRTSNPCGNSIYSISFDDKTLSGDEPIPLFGAKYNFHLEGVVDCPEFLVHFPTLCKLAERHNLQLVGKRRFANYFNHLSEDGRELLVRMNALETYPPFPNVKLVGDTDGMDNYSTAQKFLNRHPECSRIGSLSREEWEAATLYVSFAFKKFSAR